MGLDQHIRLSKTGLGEIKGYSWDYKTYNDEVIIYFRKQYSIHNHVLSQLKDRDDTWCIGRMGTDQLKSLLKHPDMSSRQHEDITGFLNSWDGQGEIYYEWTT
jgi:hypothetical protein